MHESRNDNPLTQNIDLSDRENITPRSGKRWSRKRAARNRGSANYKLDQGSSVEQKGANGRINDFLRAKETGHFIPPFIHEIYSLELSGPV